MASLLPVSLVLGSALLAACSGGGVSGGSSEQGGFQLVRINVLEGSIWEINRQMEFAFNERVNFATVNLNTINIQTASGMPATGEFFPLPVDADGDGVLESVDDRVVVFQPTCPTLADLSDAGLQPGAIPYVITAAGLSSGAVNTVRSLAGAQLQDSQSRNFTTPASTDAGGAFIDLVSGPPVPVVRAIGSTEEQASHIEYGTAGDTVYFEFDDVTQGYSLSEPGFEVPLNLFSDPETSVAVNLYFNQPVSPDEENISQDLLRIEFLDSSLQWQPIDTRVELVANCTATGALVRLEPVGLLPAASSFRTVVRPGFQDLVGQTNLLTIENFAVAPTTTVAFGSLDPADDQSDELLEPFQVGGAGLDSFEDAEALFESPKAEWGGGVLAMAFDFNGHGGPGGDFDWVIRDGDIFFFDTTATTIVGGPGGIPTTSQNTVGGFVDVRNLIIEEGGLLRIQGPNVFTLTATETIQIRGTLDASGFNAKNVATLDTGHQPEIGGAGAAGGGKGGTASWITNNSTPYGGRGWGAFDLTNGGGEGGESAYTPSTNKHFRRPGGGGGGAFAAEQLHYPLGTVGSGTLLYAHEGNRGYNKTGGDTSGKGAVSNVHPARGGFPGPGPFLDGDDTNNFWGVYPDDSGPTTEIIAGELTDLHAGAGGGAGGDAIFHSAPQNPDWTIFSDEKGGGGGGGGGGVNLRALGPIVFGNAGALLCAGGLGATGENVLYFDHIGGSGGSGSGGHVVLQTASYIDFTDGNPGATVRTWISAAGGPEVIGNTNYLGDDPEASHGGEGGPGVIQLHVPDPLAPVGTVIDENHDIFVPTAAALQTYPLHMVAMPGPLPMVPRFGARSVARSRWISVGAAAQDPGGGLDLVRFLFRGTDAAGDGRVLASGGAVDELPPLLAEPITGSATVAVLPDGVTLSIAGVSLSPLIDDPGEISNDLYLRTPALLKNFVLRLQVVGDPASAEDFDITAAAYDDASVVLTLLADDRFGSLQSYLDDAAGDVEYALIPRFFRVSTGGTMDALPDEAKVKILFDATSADQFGNPDEANLLVEETPDIADFNDLVPGELQFFRFHVVFELDEVTLDTEPVALDFVRIPFRF
ncbi:MAG: hypothetical protein AB1726_15170 [Planctomycetota bacterium]